MRFLCALLGSRVTGKVPADYLRRIGYKKWIKRQACGTRTGTWSQILLVDEAVTNALTVKNLRKLLWLLSLLSSLYGAPPSDHSTRKSFIFNLFGVSGRIEPVKTSLIIRGKSGTLSPWIRTFRRDKSRKPLKVLVNYQVIHFLELHVGQLS